jgi:tRNA(fMet)-specific endonuclease VapC
VSEALLDTDILSFYFKGDLKTIERVGGYPKEYDQLNISIITYYEILGGLKFKKANAQLREFEEFVSNNNLIYISERSAQIAGDIYADLRSRGVTIGTSDILIAGTALENDLTLVTNNEKHFEAIPMLKIENWKK